MTMMDFKLWLEIRDEDLPDVPLSDPIPWETWRNWGDTIKLFVYGNMMNPTLRPLEDFDTGRARGVIRVYDSVSPEGHIALSLRQTGRIKDSVNGILTDIPGEEIENLANQWSGYDLVPIKVVRTDAETGLVLKKIEDAFYMTNPQSVEKEQPEEETVRSAVEAAFNISPEFGREFQKTTYRLPKRGKRLVRITR